MSAAVEQFLYLEARLLDEQRFDDWLALFTDDGYYWLPLEPGQDNPVDTVSLIYDDRRALETRVRQLSNPSRHAQSPRSRTNHLIGNIVIDSEEGDAVIVSSNQHVLEARGDTQRLFGGQCRMKLVPAGDSFKIAWKRLELVNCDAVHDGFNIPI